MKQTDTNRRKAPAAVFDKANKLLNDAHEVLLTTHIRPDGDACGCVRALADILKQQGKKVHILFLSPLASWYQAMFDEKPPVLTNDIQPADLPQTYAAVDLIVIVDTDSRIQLPGLADWLAASGKPILVIDHHVTGDHLGQVELVDAAAAAAGEIVFDLFQYAGWPLTIRMAESIFIAISTDTGWFKYSNADSRIFQTAARLINLGVRPNEIYQRMYQSFSPARLRLMTRMLEHLQLHSDGRIATQYILRRDFDETGASGPDTENLIDECQRIGSVEAAVLLIELADGGFRCSLRSKGRVDVRLIAQNYGGGGHTLAAGVNLHGALDDLLDRLVREISLQLK
ncbi:MAG: bifunctional oligoribonuclease/PAP phosphatase NrnA [Planctomycetaceae bacterium]|nr:bifunctional oligoribonuclease/PAP phosphatase NrnA [Planctomycetaceae bacterium]